MARPEHHGEHGAAARTATACPGPVADRGKGRFDWVGGADALPLPGRELKRGWSSNPRDPYQVLCGFRIHGFTRGREMVNSLVGIVPGFGHSDLLPCRLHPGLAGIRHRSKHASGPAHPATLVTGLRKDVTWCRPESRGAPSPLASRGAFMPRRVRSGSTSAHRTAGLRILVAQTCLHPVCPDMHHVAISPGPVAATN